MKRVLLMRHAKSSWSDDTLTDHERPLSKRGSRDAKRMAIYFEDSAQAPDYVLCSSATRARKTYALIAKRFVSQPELVVDGSLYLPATEGLLAAIRNVPAGMNRVLVVGHSPSLDALIFLCTSKRQAELRARIADKFPTGALCVLELNSDSFADLGRKAARLVTLVMPADLDPGAVHAPIEALHAAHVDLGKKTSVVHAASLVLGECLTQIRQNATGLKHSDSPELVHQLRVGIRRLRVALRLFAPLLELPKESELETSLRWLFRELGPIRERDVFLRDVLDPALTIHAQPDLVRLRKWLLIERQAMLRDAQKALHSERYAALLSQALSLEAALGASKDAARLMSWARERLDRRLERVIALKPAIEQRDPAALHMLRRELKKLRYAAEFLAGAFAEKRAKTYLKRLGTLQDVLGVLNDVAVGERLLSRGLKHLRAGRSRNHAREALRSTFDGLATESALSLPRSFAAFEAQKPFWR